MAAVCMWFPNNYYNGNDTALVSAPFMVIWFESEKAEQWQPGD